MKVALKEIKDKMNIRYLFAKYAIAKQSDKSVVVSMEGEDIAICGEVVEFPDPVLLIQNDKFAGYFWSSSLHPNNSTRKKRKTRINPLPTHIERFSSWHLSTVAVPLW